MKQLLRIAGLATAMAIPMTLAAQMAPTVQHPPREKSTWNHGEFAAYGDYFRFAPSGHNAVNFVGFGGRVGFNVHPNVAIEGEMAYDFARNFTTVTSKGGTTTTITSGVRPITGLLGPKFQFGTSGPFRAFLTGKAGFTEFSVSNKSVSPGTFGSAFDQFGGASTHFAAYPGGGIEAFIGPVGIRAEVGDEIIVNNGASNNLRATIGPSIRF